LSHPIGLGGAANKINLKKRNAASNLPRFAYLLGNCLFILLYWAETEIHKIKDDSKIKRQTNLYRRYPRPIPIICHLLDPHSFSLPTTFNKKYYFLH
jgi:hypothetical protein